MWRLEQNAERADRLDLYIYGDVEGDSWDWWSGEVIESETSANHFRDALAAHPDAKEIHIFINSYGGSVFEGTAIYNQLRRHPAQKIVHVDGFACSIASVIAMAGDRVIMPRNTMMMIHNMWMMAMGNAAELRKAADDLDVINTAGMQAYLQKAGDKLDADSLREMMDAETWLTAEDCIRLGLADEYAEEDADQGGMAEILQKATHSLQQSLSLHRAIAAQIRELRRGTEEEQREGNDAPPHQSAAPTSRAANHSQDGSQNAPATPQGEALTEPEPEQQAGPAPEEPAKFTLISTMAGNARK